MTRTTNSAARPGDGVRKPLRVGVILDTLVQPRWIRHALDRVQESSVATFALVIVAEGSGQTSLHHAGRARSQLLYRVFLQMDRKVFRRQPDPLELAAVHDTVGDAPVLTIPGTSAMIGDDYRQRIRDAELDVILCLGSVDIGCQLVTDVPDGVWYFPDLAARIGTAQPVGFGSTIAGTSSVATTLNELAADGSPGRTLYQAWSAVNRYSPHYTERRLLWKMANFPLRALASLHSAQQLTAEDSEPTPKQRIARSSASVAPSNLAMLSTVARMGARQLRHAIRSALYRSEWSVAYRREPGLTLDSFTQPMTAGSFAFLDGPPDRFWADPFPVASDDTVWLFVEEFPHGADRAHLSVMELHPDGRVGSSTQILTCPYHLSYPFVFQWRGEWYMVPETLENRAVDLYRSSNFPFEWTHAQRLLDGVSAVDATLVEHEGRWWMFTTIAPFGGSENDELHIFMADSPIGPWMPHPANPQKSDVRSSRPAGRIFSSGGALYRPAQDCSRRYGGTMTINRITCLTETAFGEEAVARIDPVWAPGLLGTHTLNHASGMTLVDGDRWRPRYPFLPTW